jgi:hypothetical protein
MQKIQSKITSLYLVQTAENIIFNKMQKELKILTDIKTEIHYCFVIFRFIIINSLMHIIFLEEKMSFKILKAEWEKSLRGLKQFDSCGLIPCKHTLSCWYIIRILLK